MKEFKPSQPPEANLIHLEELTDIQLVLARDVSKLSEDSVRAMLRLFEGVLSARREVIRLRYFHDQYQSWQREMDKFDIPYETSKGTKLSALGRLVEFLVSLRRMVPSLKHGTPITLKQEAQ